MKEKLNHLFSKERVEFFSDAVFAIILTLLVLELHVPEIADHSSFGQYAIAMAPLVPKLTSFIFSFLVISIHWVAHHHFFQRLRSAPLGLVWLNNLFLLWLCFMPFPTALLGDHPADQFPILLYAVNQLFAALTFFAFRAYAVHKKIFTDNTTCIKSLGPKHSIPAITIYSLSILLVFINVYLSLACFLMVPVLYLVPNMMRSK